MSPKSTLLDSSRTPREKQNDTPHSTVRGVVLWCLYATQRGERIFVVIPVAGVVSTVVRCPVVPSVAVSVAGVVVGAVVKKGH